MKTAIDTANNTSTYVYDGDGRRIKRIVGNTETLQIYGLGGELVAEYAANTSPGNPQKEYGYRNGEMLITADAPPSNSAAFVTTDSTTQGNWKGNYGADGYNIINDAVSYPAYAQVSVTGQSAYTWAASTTETRALVKAAPSTDRLASCWYSGTNFTIDINLIDGNSHRVAVYALDWDGANGRNGTIDVFDANTNLVLDTQPLNSYSDGKYFVWQMRGHIKIKFSHISPSGWNQVVSGLFFDTNLAFNRPTSQSSEGWGGASNRAVDGNTDGNWFSNSVTHTLYDNGAWWRVDLGATYSVKSVEVWNRSDCCAERLTNFNVVLLDANYAVVNSVNVPGQGGYPTTVAISGGARWVVVHLVGTNYLSLAEVKVFGAPAAPLHWLVTDQLGTPRMVFDQTGSLANMNRHDYLPFGEEVPGNFRTGIGGYATGDNVRQKFTQYERDNENGLDFAQSRYYPNAHGRFSSPDRYNIFFEMKRGKDGEEQDWIRRAYIWEPQNWNRYAYCINNPTNLFDPSGLIWVHDTKENLYIFVKDDDYHEGNQYYDNQDQYQAVTEGPNGVTFVLQQLTGSANTPENQALIGQEVFLGSDGMIHPTQATSYVNDTLGGGWLSGGLITDSNSQVFFTLGFGPSKANASYSRTFGKGPVQTGLFGNLSAANGLAASESINLLHPTQGVSTETGLGTPNYGIGVQVVIGPLQGTTPSDWEMHPDNPKATRRMSPVGRCVY